MYTHRWKNFHIKGQNIHDLFSSLPCELPFLKCPRWKNFHIKGQNIHDLFSSQPCELPFLKCPTSARSCLYICWPSLNAQLLQDLPHEGSIRVLCFIILSLMKHVTILYLSFNKKKVFFISRCSFVFHFAWYHHPGKY